MKSFMFLLERRIIKYSLLLLKLGVRLYITVTHYHLTSLDSAVSEWQAACGSEQWRNCRGGLGNRKKSDFKTSFDILMLTNYLKELLYHQ